MVEKVFCLAVGTGQNWPCKDRMARIEHHSYFKKLLLAW